MPLLAQAITLHREGRFAQAENLYNRILVERPDHDSALNLLGALRQQQGRHEEALRLIGRALTFDPGKAIYHNNYGAALLALQRYDEALAAFERALEIRPQYADALANRGMAFVSFNRFDEALADFNAALRIEPKHVDARRQRISLLHRLGRSDEAIALCKVAIAEQPCAVFFGKLGELLIDTRRPQAAVGPLLKAVELDPRRAVDRFNLGTAFELLGDIPAARQQFECAAAITPTNAFWQLRAATIAPVVLQSTEEAETYCEQLTSFLDIWRESAPVRVDAAQILTAGAYPPLAIAYQGRNQKSLKEKFAALYEPYLQPIKAQSRERWDAPRDAQSFHADSVACASGFDAPCRIGIVVTERHETMFLASMRGIIENLDRERFEVVILCSERIIPTLRARIHRDDLTFAGFDPSLTEAAHRIRETACDLIYYWEVGTDALNYFLPFLRLAPVQTTGWGSTITTGNAAIDHFMSSELIERLGSDDQYTERLWKSKTLFRCQERLPPTPPALPGDFGLPDDRNLYICFQNPLKLHPDFDPLIAGVLACDPKALIVLMADQAGNVAKLLKERFARRIPGAERIVFLPHQSFENYCRLIQLAHVVLDTPHFGTSSSCYDLFSYNLPLVTLPGELIVGRMAQACYRKMGVFDLIAQNPVEYVNTAVKVATDRDYRAFVVKRIADSSDALFNDLEAVREYERFFTEALVAI